MSKTTFDRSRKWSKTPPPGMNSYASVSRWESSPTWLAERWPLLRTPSGSPATIKVSCGCGCGGPSIEHSSVIKLWWATLILINNLFDKMSDLASQVFCRNCVFLVPVLSCTLCCQVTTLTYPRWPTYRRMSWSTCMCSADQWSSTMTMTSFGQKLTWTQWWAEPANQRT